MFCILQATDLCVGETFENGQINKYKQLGEVIKKKKNNWEKGGVGEKYQTLIK